MNEPHLQQQLGLATEDDRRREPRYASDNLAVVTILASGKVVEGRTVDISRSGLRVRTDRVLEKGSRIRIKFGAVIAFGDVRWCRPANGAFDIGIEVAHTLEQSLVDSVHSALERVRYGS